MAGPRYSLHRYGLPAEGTALRRSFLGVATLRLSCLARQDLTRTLSVSERLRLDANLSSGMRRQAVLHGDLTVTASARSQYKRELRAATTVGLSVSAVLGRAGRLDGVAALGLRVALSTDRGAGLAASATLSLEARLTACLCRGLVLSETLEGAAAACADVRAALKAVSGVSLTASACKDLGHVMALAEALGLLSTLGKKEGRRLALAAQAGGRAEAVKDLPKALTSGAGLYLRAASGLLERTVCTVRCTIPPGGALVIDTERFAVTLDGENALHLQEGGWPQLSRDLVSLAVSSATGGALEGKVVYQEAYL